MDKAHATYSDLQQLYSSYRGCLGVYSWERESDRWGELVAVALYEGADVPPAIARQTVWVLEQLGANSPGTMSQRDGSELMRTILKRLSIPAGEATKASKLVSELARSVEKRWAGHVQRLVRAHAKSILLDFKRAMSDVRADDEVIERIGAVWLQNAFHVPLFHRSDAHLEAFRKSHGLTEDEFIDIADATGISLPVIDDLIAMRAEDSATPLRNTKSKARAESRSKAGLVDA